MALLDFQTAIARLCINPGFRRRFSAQDNRVLEDLDLTPAEKAALRSLDLEAVKDYGTDLLHKRMEMIRSWVSSTIAALESRLGSDVVHEILHQYVESRVRIDNWVGSECIRRETQCFLGYLSDQVSNDIGMPYLPDLARYEITMLVLRLDDPADQDAVAVRLSEDYEPASLRPKLRSDVRLERFDYDVTANGASEGAVADPPWQPEGKWLLFVRRNVTTVDVHAVTPLLAAALEMCDGLATIEDILARLIEKFGLLTDGDIRAQCLDAFRECFAAQLLCV